MRAVGFVALVLLAPCDRAPEEPPLEEVEVVAEVPAAEPLPDPCGYFPPGTFSPRSDHDQLIARLYGMALEAMGEPSLCDAAREGRDVYRLLWLRSFQPPVAVRIERDRSGVRVIATRLTGRKALFPGRIAVRLERKSTPAEWGQVELALANARFDTMGREYEDGLDGAQWIIERARGGAYRLRERWSPTERGFLAAGELFILIGGPEFSGRVY